jgi:hypothetical protein
LELSTWLRGLPAEESEYSSYRETGIESLEERPMSERNGGLRFRMLEMTSIRKRRPSRCERRAGW